MTAIPARTQAITALYVPGDRPDRFDKAYSSGADVVIVDWEDAVATESRVSARQSTVEWIGTLPELPSAPVRLQIRVNAGDADDLRALAGLPSQVGIRVPKVEAPGDLVAASEIAPGHPVTALIESSAGIENASAIARHDAVVALALGEADLASDLGSDDPALVDHLRIRALLAARSAGLAAPMLSAYPRLRDLDGLRADTERGRRLGLFGRVAVHPRQLAVIDEVFAPTREETEWAVAVLAALESGGVSTLPNGDMVDPAMAGRARRLLER